MRYSRNTEYVTDNEEATPQLMDMVEEIFFFCEWILIV